MNTDYPKHRYLPSPTDQLLYTRYEFEVVHAYNLGVVFFDVNTSKRIPFRRRVTSEWTLTDQCVHAITEMGVISRLQQLMDAGLPRYLTITLANRLGNKHHQIHYHDPQRLSNRMIYEWDRTIKQYGPCMPFKDKGRVVKIA